MNSIETTLRQIEKEYNENNQKINDLDFKIRSLNGADIEYIGGGAVAFGTIPWMASILSTPSLVKWGAIPIEWLTILQAAVPAAIGYGGISLLLKKNKTKENIATFSTAKTQREIVMERAGYEAEQANLKDINTMLSHVHNTLSSRSRLLTSLEPVYNISPKNVNVLPRQEELTELENGYETQLQKLKIASTRHFLGDKYFRQRDRMTKAMSYTLTPLMSYVFSMMLFGAPHIISRKEDAVPSPLLQIEFLGLPAVVSATSLIYLIYRNKVQTAAFKNLNDQLGTSAIPAHTTSDENLKDELYSSIIDVANMKMALEDARRRYETLSGLPLGTLSIPSTISDNEENLDTSDSLTSSKPTPEYQAPLASDIQEEGKKLRKTYPSYGEYDE